MALYRTGRGREALLELETLTHDLMEAHNRMSEVDRELAIRAALTLVQPMRSAGGGDDYEKIFTSAKELALSVGDQGMLARSHFALGLAELLRGDLAGAADDFKGLKSDSLILRITTSLPARQCFEPPKELGCLIFVSLRGKAQLVRFADDFVITFEREDDAVRVRDVVGRRFSRFGLTLHPDKARLLPYRRPRTPSGKGPATFDFLGFTHYWARSRKGYWVPRVKTRAARLRRSIVSIEEWCRRHRHSSVKEQHAALVKRSVGYLNYFAVSGNSRALWQFLRSVGRIWHKWLNRRSQRSRLTWDRFNDLLRDFPLAKVKIRISLWQQTP